MFSIYIRFIYLMFYCAIIINSYYFFVFTFSYLFWTVGEASGKSSKSVARHYPGGTVEQVKAQSSSLAGDVYRARQVCFTLTDWNYTIYIIIIILKYWEKKRKIEKSIK